MQVSKIFPKCLISGHFDTFLAAGYHKQLILELGIRLQIYGLKRALKLSQTPKKASRPKCFIEGEM